MSNQKILDYVDSVMSNIKAPYEEKLQIENELIRSIMNGTEIADLDEVKNSLSSPDKLAEEISRNLAKSRVMHESKECGHHKPHRRVHQRYVGEFMQERSNVNIKLLYIPLIQISSGTQRITCPLTEEDEEEDED